MCRVIAYCHRFLGRTKPSSPTAISAEEYDNALLIVIRQAQQFYFKSEISDIQSKRKCSLSSLNPFLDTQGLLRVNGRLANADLSLDERYPIILPPKSNLQKLIIQKTHKTLCHSGTQLTLAAIRKRFWILQGKRSVKKVLHGCFRCFKIAARLQHQMMAPLPAVRSRPSRPFTHTGIDYAGPVIIKPMVRSIVTMKAYIAVFICLSTRAVHLESVSNLSTEAFLASLRRFTARRGCSEKIYSDNDSNFHGAENELQDMYDFLNINQSTVEKDLATRHIKWHFNPPLAPHHGGIWEAAVKSTKYHLRRVMGLAQFTFEELVTTLCQIEACLNSRPICPLSDDVNDLNPLTPGHFLLGDAPTAPPGYDLTNIRINRVNRWQLIQRAVQEFWRRWQTEYLARLQSRPKWFFRNDDIKIGDLVILKEENLPPLHWRLGRVATLHPGKDMVTRVVTIKIKNQKLQRPVQAIIKLPYEDNLESDII